MVKIELRIPSKVEEIPAEYQKKLFLRGAAFWAVVVGLCAETIERARRKGDLEFIRVGDRALHSAAHIERWLQAREQNTKRVKDIA